VLTQTSVLTLLAAGLISVAMFFLAGPLADLLNNPSLAKLLRIFAVYPFAERLTAMIPAYMISLDRAIRSGVYAVVIALGRATLAVAAFGAGAEMAWVLCACMAFMGLVAAVGWLDMARLSAGGRWRIDRALLVAQFRYTWPIWLTGILATINLGIDKLVISAFFDPATYAVYSCGAMQLPVVGIVTVSLSAAMMPSMVSFSDRGQNLDALALWQEGARKCSLVIFPCFIFFLVIAPDLMVLLYGRPYALAVWPFTVYLTMLPVQVAVYSSIFRAIGRTGPVAVAGLISVCCNVTVSVMLTWLGRGTLLGFIGPSLGILVAYLTSAAYMLVFLARIMNVPFRRIMPWKDLGVVMLLCATAALTLIVIRLEALVLPVRLAAQAAVYAAALVLLGWKTGVLREDEKELLRIPGRLLWGFRRRRKRPGDQSGR